MKESICSNGGRQQSYPSLSKPSYSPSRVPTSTTSLVRQGKKNSRSSGGSTRSTPRLPFSDHARSSPSWQMSKSTSEGTEYETIAPKWGLKPSIRGQISLNQGQGQSTKSIPTSCEASPLTGQIKCGESTSPTSGWHPTGCTSWPSSTGTADTSLLGRSQKPWSYPSCWTVATRRWARPCRRLSTQTKVATSRRSASPAASRRREPESPWTVEAVMWTTFSPNACGARSNTRRST